MGPTHIINGIAESLGAVDVFGVYSLPCNSTFTVTLHIGDREYPIPARQLLLKENKECILAMYGSDDFGFFILGNPFVRYSKVLTVLKCLGSSAKFTM